MDPMLDTLRARYNAAADKMQRSIEALEAAGEDADVAQLRADFDAAEKDARDAREALEHAERVQRAREDFVPVDRPSAGEVRVGQEPAVYSQDGEHSFFSDMIARELRHDTKAAERIERHDRQMQDAHKRDVTSGGGAAGVIPPVYLPSLYAGLERYGRPFVSSLPKMQLPSLGTSFTLPKVVTGSTTAAQGSSENTGLSETDMDINSVTVYVATIGGVQDYSLQSAERSDPAFDAIVARDLMEAYWQQSEVEALTGAGTAGEIMGLANVGSIQTTTWTEATPTQADLLPKVYEAISEVHSNHYRPPDRLVMHPRRASWLAAGVSTSGPLFQQGMLYRAHGDQDMGAVGSFGGLPVIASAAIPTTLGTGTNEDLIYAVNGSVMYWMESALRTEVFRSPGSAAGTVRVRVYGYAAFVSARYPNAISQIGGTGLVAPTF